MIRNRLAALMGERGLKITRVAKDTGISRNSITSISQNDSEMMRMETVNTLCKYLGVTPCEFFEYEPIDIDFSVYINNLDYLITDQLTDAFTSVDFIQISIVDVDVIMDVNKNQQTESFDLHCSLIENVKFCLSDPGNFDYGIDLEIEFENDAEKNDFVDEIYNKINSSFHQDVYQSLINKLNNEMREFLLQDIENNIHNTPYKQNLKKGINSFFIIKKLQSDVFKKF